MDVGSVVLSSARLMPLPVLKVLRALLLSAEFPKRSAHAYSVARPILTLLSSGLLDAARTLPTSLGPAHGDACAPALSCVSARLTDPDSQTNSGTPETF